MKSGAGASGWTGAKRRKNQPIASQPIGGKAEKIMELKNIKIIDPSAQGGQKTIAINIDKVVQVNPVGADDSEIVLDNATVYKSSYTFTETVNWLNN
jgi:hypothetical protein